MQVCIVYIVKEVASFWWLGQLMGMACKRYVLKLQTSRMTQKNVKLILIV